MTSFINRPGRFAAVMVFVLAGGAAPTQAATVMVTNNANTGPGSLREVAYYAADGDTIEFDFPFPAGVAVADLAIPITKNLTIAGPGADLLNIDGGGGTSTVLFTISDPVTLTITGVTIKNAGLLAFQLNSGSMVVSQCAFINNGRAIATFGNLLVDDSVFSGNSINNLGAAIYEGSGTATITHSTFTGNSASDSGGAIFNQANMTISNSTFSDNASNDNPGSRGGAILNAGTMVIDTSTFTGNRARGYGGAIAGRDGVATTVTGSTFSGNASFVGGDSFAPGPQFSVSRSVVENCDSPVISTGDNLGGDSSCFPASAALNDRVNLDPRLGDLADNGGPTKTMALLSGSPAIDQVIVNAATCTGTDQRGVARPGGPRCDIGAYERDGDLLFADGFD